MSIHTRCLSILVAKKQGASLFAKSILATMFAAG